MRQGARANLFEVIWRYGLSVATVGAALLLTLLLWRWIEPQATPLFLAAVAVTAWRGGVLPSLLATALAVVAVDYFFSPPVGAFEASVDNAAGAFVFVTVALLISWIDVSRKRALRERDRLLASEQQARAEAETANRAKDQFLAMVSHELRTPLAVILGWTRLLKDEVGEQGRAENGEQAKALDATARMRALEAIERNALVQKNLVEDLLDVSRITNGKFRVEMRPINLVPVIETAIETVAPVFVAKRIKLHAEYDREAGFIHGDADRLQQVMWNLLSNAAKFTPEGGQVEVRLERAGGYARVVVHDTGAGITREFLPHVFDRFRQGDDVLTRRSGGLGLGLAIVRHLIEAHSGTIHAKSAGEGLGSTFTVELPLVAAAPPHDRRVLSLDAERMTV
ncbi:MAG TPA: HAMP domain-containing sensor histidine kinase [Pyrinomonadaceae bacterium]|nr:HAMP domain-containing sensor histidine kinase [Pyrinomonadaceae bacterium]